MSYKYKTISISEGVLSVEGIALLCRVYYSLVITIYWEWWLQLCTKTITCTVIC